MNRWSFLALLLMMLAPATIQAAIDIPRQVGDIYVQDHANLLTAAERDTLLTVGKELEEKTGAQISLVTLHDPGEYGAEEMAQAIFRSYHIGQEYADNGVLLLLLISPEYWDIRIETGYGLEGIIPDGKAGSILDEYAFPAMQAGAIHSAIKLTYFALAREILQAHDSGDLPASKPSAPNPVFRYVWIVLTVMAFLVIDALWFKGMFTGMLLQMPGRFGGRRGRGGRSGGGGASRRF